MQCLKWGGTIVTCGATSGFDAHLDIRLLWNKQQNYLGSHLGNKGELIDAMRFVESGHIKPVVGEVLRVEGTRQGAGPDGEQHDRGQDRDRAAGGVARRGTIARASGRARTSEMSAPVLVVGAAQEFAHTCKSAEQVH